MSVYLPYMRLQKYEDGFATFSDELGEVELRIPLVRWNEIDRSEYVTVRVSEEKS